MRLTSLGALLLLPASLSKPIANSTFDPLLYVDQLIGTVAGGNVFPGASLPYGMAKPGADTDHPSNQGGFVFDPNANITGFSVMHDSGTGGAPSLGVFALFPHASCSPASAAAADDDINACVFPKRTRKTRFDPDSVRAHPGFFELSLTTDVRVAMTASRRTALFRFVFPERSGGAGGSGPVLLMDLTDLSDSRQDNATIAVDPSTGRMTGAARFLPSFAQGSYVAYFCADVRGPGAGIRDGGIYANSRASAAVRELSISRSINGYPLPGGAWLRFRGAGEVLARVGVSMVGQEQACRNAEEEIPEWDFEGVRAEAERVWREKLSPIKVEGSKVNETMLKIFYSGIYRTMINPQDYTGENPFWDTGEPYFDSFYCLWDSFRSQLPFLTVLDPEQLARMIRSLIDTYSHEGWLPDCRMTFSKGYTQGGSNADVVLADAYLKGIKNGIDWEKGYEAVVKDAEEEPYNWCCQGRGGLDSWKELGYIPVQDFDYKGFGTMTRSISRTLEYSYNDFVISQMAAKLGGRDGDVEKYLGRARNWANLFKKDTPSPGTPFTGFFQPRHLNRTFGVQDPLKCSGIDRNPNSVCSLQNSGAETFESSIWEYGFFVPHDQAGLIATYGGPNEFVRRLEYLHDEGITGIGNEPAFLTVFQYHYAGRPALSAKRSHFYIPSAFSAAHDGLPGNDDSGAMGSYIAFSMMGLFPNPGQNVYLITPPFFERIAVTSPLTGKTAVVRVTNFDPTYAAVFIQRVTLNGAPYAPNWIGHDFFTRGGELAITVGTEESAWGTRVRDLPPSVGEYLGFGDWGAMSVPMAGTGVRTEKGMTHEDGKGVETMDWEQMMEMVDYGPKTTVGMEGLGLNGLPVGFMNGRAV